MHNLRLKYGMFWATKYPPIPARQLAIVCLCALTYGAVAKIGNLETRVEVMHDRADAATRAANIYAAYKTTLLKDCSGGGDRGFVIGDRGYVCSVTQVHP